MNNQTDYDQLNKYQKLEKIGEGSYGVVYKAKVRDTGVIVALKKMRLEGDGGASSTAIREVSILREWQHNNVVRLPFALLIMISIE